MATYIPRQRLFGPTTTTSTSFLFILLCTSSLWFIYCLSGALTLSVPVSGEDLLDSVVKIPSNLRRAPRSRSLIHLDSADYYNEKTDAHVNLFNNPAILEGSPINDGYESLRQLDEASSQPFFRKRLFNTSVALTVPLFSFTLPHRFPEGMTIDLANQALFGVLAFIIVFLVFAVPVVFTGTKPFSHYTFEHERSNNEESTQIILDHLMKAGEGSTQTVNFMGTDLKNKIGLNPDQCLQKTICDAHRYPKKYGLFALPFQLLFPPYPPGSEEGLNNSYSIYQQAAETGEYHREEKCWENYRCFFDIMDLAIYLMDYFNSPASRKKVNAGIQLPFEF